MIVFTNTGPGTYILLCKNSYTSISCITISSPPRSEQSRGQPQDMWKKESAGAATNLFMWMSHFSMAGVIKQTKLSSFFKKKQVNELISVKIVITQNCHNVKVIFVVYMSKM